jgi:PAS domain S-box-containing protein
MIHTQNLVPPSPVKEACTAPDPYLQLQQQAQLLSSMYEGVEHSICIVDVVEAGLEHSEFRFVGWNPATERITGIASADIAGKTPEELLGETHGPIIQQNYQRCLTAGHTITYEECVPFQGRDVWWLTTLNPLKDEHDRIYRIVITTFDISDRKAAETALRQTEAQYRAIFESINDGIVISDLETGAITTVNPAACRMFGYSPTEFVQLSPRDYVYESSLPKFADFLNTIQAGKTFACEAIDIRKNGELFDVEVKAVPLLLNDRLYALALLRDISETQRLEAERKANALEIARLYAEEQEKSQQLKERNHLLAFQSATSQIAAHNDDLPTMLQQFCQVVVDHLQAAFARIWLVNPAKDMLELKASAGLYTHIDGGHQYVPVGQFKIGLIAAEKKPHLTNDVFHDPRVGDPEWAKREGLIAFAGHPLVIGNELMGVMAMFARVPLSESTLASLETATTEISLGIQRRLLEATVQQKAVSLEQTLQELQQTQLQMVQSEKMSSLGQLVAGIAHEINNPVSFIHGNVIHVNGYAQDLLELIELYQQTDPQPTSPADRAIAEKIEAIDLDFLQDDLPKLLTSIKTGTQRIQAIVQSLRSFSRLDEADVKAVDIHEGIDSTLMILQHRLKADSVRPGISVMKRYGTLPPVECFAGQLNQVLMNLLANAIDALEVRDQQRSLDRIQQEPSTISIATELTADRRVIIRITDNGPGIPEAIHHRLFDPFFTTKPVGQGTGLGLSTSYQIITQCHHGQLYFQSVLGQGTEFVIDIPVQQATPTP